MPNLNYISIQGDTQDDTQGTLNRQIIALIRKDCKLSTERMAIALGVSVSTIKRHIKTMENVNYIGRGYSGHWEITEKDV